MQKTFHKFVIFELAERIARFRLLLTECAPSLLENSPALYQSLLEECGKLEEQVLSHKAGLNRLFSDSAAGKSQSSSVDPWVPETYQRLCQLSQVLLKAQNLSVEPETHLYLRDVVPADLWAENGEHSVFVDAEGAAYTGHSWLPQILIDGLPNLAKNNPLAWVGLTQALTRRLVERAALTDSLKVTRKLPENLLSQLVVHATNLRLHGPAYYFYGLTESVLRQDEVFLHFIEPALFYGLNHFNYTHKNLVILHEACERIRTEGASTDGLEPLNEETLAKLYRAVENLLSERASFQDKHLERAVQLQDRLSRGVLLSSSPLFPIEEVEETLAAKRDSSDFSIYEVLSMMTEYPHTPREIVNAGWLHKIERGPVWLYSTLNGEAGEGGFARLSELLDYQDHLLKKSIETSEVHRGLLCTP